MQLEGKRPLEMQRTKRGMGLSPVSLSLSLSLAPSPPHSEDDAGMRWARQHCVQSIRGALNCATAQRGVARVRGRAGGACMHANHGHGSARPRGANQMMSNQNQIITSVSTRVSHPEITWWVVPTARGVQSIAKRECLTHLSHTPPACRWVAGPGVCGHDATAL